MSTIPRNGSVAIIGSGPMGLAVALSLLERGYQVDIFERDDRIGGMSAHFDFDGTRIERYYHFVCKGDRDLFELLSNLGLSSNLAWVDTRMGYYHDGQMYPWGTPQALLTFPGLRFFDKIRYGLHVLMTRNVTDWRTLDRVTATDWLRRWLGEDAFAVLWKRAFDLKFYEHSEKISAAWLGTRIKRVALSRRNPLQEVLGYLRGGSETLLAAMASKVVSMGGRVRLGVPVERVNVNQGCVTGLATATGDELFDTVVSTMPIQYVPRLVPDLPVDFAARIQGIENIPVACVILKLKAAISENFWTNISDSRIDIPGIIEYSNLNAEAAPGQHILYAPFYMPTTHPKWVRTNQEFVDEVIGYLRLLNPEFREDWVLASRCHRYEYAQTICPSGFFDKLPPMRTPIGGFFMADTCYYYPEDRSISESVRVGNELARVVATV